MADFYFSFFLLPILHAFKPTKSLFVECPLFCIDFLQFVSFFVQSIEMNESFNLASSCPLEQDPFEASTSTEYLILVEALVALPEPKDSDLEDFFLHVFSSELIEVDID